MTQSGQLGGARERSWPHLVAGVAIAAALSTSAHAGDVGQSAGEAPVPCRFVLRHDKQLTIQDGKKSMVLKAGEVPPPFLLHSTDGAQCVELGRQNPVLFKYSWKLEEKTKSENYVAALAFAGTLQELTKNLTPVIAKAMETDDKATASANSALKSANIEVKTLAQAVDRRRALKGVTPEVLKKLDDVLSSPDVSRQLEVGKALEEAGIPNSTVFLNEVKDSLSALQACVTAMDDAMGQLVSGKRPLPNGFCPESKPENLENALSGNFRRIDAGQAALLKMAMGDERGLADQPFFVASTLLQFQRQEALEAARKVGSFKRQLDEMQEPLRLGTVDYQSTEDQWWVLRIEPITENTRGKEVKEATGDFKLRFIPSSPVKLGVGAAVIYSFVDDVKFTTQPVDGGFKIIKSPDQDQYKAEGIAAVLTITPRGWTDPTFGGFFEIGVQPTDHLGLLAGAGIRLFDIASIGAGIAFQQIDVLAPGLSLGDTIAAESDLKTAKRFKAGLYLHATVSIDVKK